MKLNITQPIKSLDGTPIKDDQNQELTLKVVLVNALLTQNEEKLTGEEKYKRYSLSKKIYESDEEVELSIEEVAQLKRLIGDLYPPLVVGQVFDILEGR